MGIRLIISNLKQLSHYNSWIFGDISSTSLRYYTRYSAILSSNKEYMSIILYPSGRTYLTLSLFAVCYFIKVFTLFFFFCSLINYLIFAAHGALKTYRWPNHVSLFGTVLTSCQNLLFHWKTSQFYVLKTLLTFPL